MNIVRTYVRHPIKTIAKYLNAGHARSVLAKKNILLSLLLKGLDMGAGILLVPLVLNYLNSTKYGIWLTLTSIVTWFNYLDLGLGQGLRNRFAEARAAGEKSKAKTYISTTYALVIIVITIFLPTFVILNRYLPWDKILHVNSDLNGELRRVTFIVFSFFSLEFVLKLIGTIVVADQKPAIRDATAVAGKMLVLVGVYTITLTIPASLIGIAIVYSGFPVFALAVASFLLFSGKYKEHTPSIRSIDFRYTKDLMGLGSRFLIIQIALFVIMSTDNIIISQLFGPQMVTPYQIAYKYFNIILVVYSIIITPLWSASSEAFVKGDYDWIKSTIRKLHYLTAVFVMISLVMLLVSQQVYHIWIGSRIRIPYLLSFLWMMFTIVGMYNGIYFSVINGFGRVRIEMSVYLSTLVLNIPLSVYFAKYLSMGVSGVILGTIICQSVHLLYLPIQYRKIVTRKVAGIWNM